MEPTTQTVTNNKSKIVIVIIVLLIIAVAILIFTGSKKQVEVTPIDNGVSQNINNVIPSSNDGGVLTQEITESTTFDNEKDLSEIDKAF